MLSRLAMSPMAATTVLRTSLRQFPTRQPNFITRNLQRDSRETYTRSERIAQRQTLRERAMAPVGQNGIITTSFSYQVLKIY